MHPLAQQQGRGREGIPGGGRRRRRPRRGRVEGRRALLAESSMARERARGGKWEEEDVNAPRKFSVSVLLPQFDK